MDNIALNDTDDNGTATQATLEEELSFIKSALTALRTSDAFEGLVRELSILVSANSRTVSARRTMLSLLELEPTPQRALFAHTVFRREKATLFSQLVAAKALSGGSLKRWQKTSLDAVVSLESRDPVPPLTLSFTDVINFPETPPQTFHLMEAISNSGGSESVDDNGFDEYCLSVAATILTSASTMGETLTTVWIHSFESGTRERAALEFLSFIFASTLMYIESDVADQVPDSEVNAGTAELSRAIARPSLVIRKRGDEYYFSDVHGTVPLSPVDFPLKGFSPDELVRFAELFGLARLSGLVDATHGGNNAWLRSVLRYHYPNLFDDSFAAPLSFYLNYFHEISKIYQVKWRWVSALQSCGYFAAGTRILENAPIKRSSQYYAGKLINGYFNTAEFEKALATAKRFGTETKLAQQQITQSTDAVELMRRLAKSMPTREIGVAPGKVVSVLHASVPFQSGGYAVRAHWLLRSLIQEGVEVKAYTRPGFPGDLSTSDSAEEMHNESTVDEVTYVHDDSFARTRANEIGYMLQSVDYYKEVFARELPEVVHLRSTYVTALPALIAARELGVPTIYEVSGLWELVFEGSGTPRMEGMRARATRFETLASKYATKVVTLTNAMKEIIASRGVNPHKIGILPNAVDPAAFDAELPTELIPATIQQWPVGVPVIGYVGSFQEYEGLDLLVEACHVLRMRGTEFRLALVGDGPRWVQVHALLNKRGLSDWAAIPGRVPHDEVAAWYQRINIAPFPRRSIPATEAVSPMKPFEAMAARKAVVVSNVAALTEIVGADRGLVFEDGSVEDLADKLEELIASASLRQELGESARTWVAAERTWKQVAGDFAARIASTSTVGR